MIIIDDATVRYHKEHKEHKEKLPGIIIIDADTEWCTREKTLVFMIKK